MSKLSFFSLLFTFTVGFAQTLGLTTSPAATPAGTPAFSLTVNLGDTLSDATPLTPQPTWVVRWNGSPRPTTVAASGGVTASISAADIAQPGFNEVTVMDQATGVVFPAVSWFLVSVDVAANDVAYDAVRNRFYVSVPSGQGTAAAPAESIASIDATSGAILGTLNVGSKPTLLSISDDSSELYVYNSGSARVSRIALATFTQDIQIPLQSGITLWWMQVVPGEPASLATIQGIFGSAESIVVYDDANVRASVVSATPITRFLFADAQTLIAGSSLEGAYIEIWKLSATAITYSSKLSSSGGPDYPVAYADGLLLGFSGDLYDTTGQMPTQVADYGGVGAMVAGQHRWLMAGFNGSNGELTIGAFDETTMTPFGRFLFSGNYGQFATPSPRILTWGTDGIAFISNNVFFWGHTALAAPAPLASQAGTVNAATLESGAVAPGEILSIFGSNLGIAAGRSLEFSSLRQVSNDLGGNPGLVRRLARYHALCQCRADQRGGSI